MGSRIRLWQCYTARLTPRAKVKQVRVNQLTDEAVKQAAFHEDIAAQCPSFNAPNPESIVYAFSACRAPIIEARRKEKNN